MTTSPHKAGYVSIIGKPNVGKSTLMNVLVGENLSIITSKAQTTRHRIQGILSGDDFQIIYSDTPGIIDPKYKLHESMMDSVKSSLDDADVLLFITDIYEKHDEQPIIERLKRINKPLILLINKVDQVKTQEEVVEKIAYWQEALEPKEIIPISALLSLGVEQVFESIIQNLPEHPAYFDKDQLTDKSERFFTAEMIRERIFVNLKKEVPYSCEVTISDFKEEPDIIRIRAVILVERDSQKGIIIGEGGKKLKQIGTEAREMLEEFFQKKVFLEQHVKVEANWRKDENKLKTFGYINK